jgi:hypothetical protein
VLVRRLIEAVERLHRVAELAQRFLELDGIDLRAAEQAIKKRSSPVIQPRSNVCDNIVTAVPRFD